MTIASMSQEVSSLPGHGPQARSAGTVSRELSRNTFVQRRYAIDCAQALSQSQRIQALPTTKLDSQHVLRGTAVSLLDWKWSPQQTAGILKRVRPDSPGRHGSHETIYTTINVQPRGELRRQLVACLRHRRSTRMLRRWGVDRREHIPAMLSIHIRPLEVDERVMPGHWKADVIRAAGNKSPLDVLVKCTGRLVLLIKIYNTTAVAVLAGLSAKLTSIAAPVHHSLTYGQDKATTRHRELNANTAVKVYFCDPHSPRSAALARTPTGWGASTCPKARACPSTLSMPSPTA